MHTTEATKTVNGKTDGDGGIQLRHVPAWVVRARYASARDTGRAYLVPPRISSQFARRAMGAAVIEPATSRM